MLCEETMKSGLKETIYRALSCTKLNNGENIVVRFSRLHTTALSEMAVLLPMEDQGLYRIRSAMKGKHGNS
jgi:hypothetical protein